MKVLHTSDWHLGRYLYKTKKRYGEFAAFLTWLEETISEREVEALLVCGDIFDTTTPTHRAQELYYSFLRALTDRRQVLRHVVIVGGNHDSPSFLEAPSKLLKSMGFHVIGAVNGDITREVLPLRDKDGRLELVVCSVPFLRESDLRTAELGETESDRFQKIIAGLSQHYAEVYELALKMASETEPRAPIAATGHLFLANVDADSDDGVREILAGPLSALPLDKLPKFDYLALGHIHSPKKVDDSNKIRYSGSPIPMGFNEAGSTKSVCLVEFSPQNPSQPEVELIPIPEFQIIKRLEGDIDVLTKEIKALKDTYACAWLEINHTGTMTPSELRHALDELLTGTNLELLALRDARNRDKILEESGETADLADLSLETVFEMIMDENKVDEAEREELRRAHAELVSEMASEDVLAE
ncbi:MAG: exonuclease SbcCD subunit D C-terminal domain-containing protein [Deltaproteobacteria bacterium]|jgi:exonuclease SbcD|nr:exonuclease SbcCD subunit D C-terminal domain-containing protein [Deltaproteobacteria bacterium]